MEGFWVWDRGIFDLYLWALREFWPFLFFLWMMGGEGDDEMRDERGCIVLLWASSQIDGLLLSTLERDAFLSIYCFSMVN